jgi:hypothetical protein
MSRPNKLHPITILPFVKDAAPKSRSDLRRSFWHVEPTGDYGEDCRIGHRYAIEYLRYELGERESPGYLGWIVKDMPDKFGGIEVGFLNMVGRVARHGLLEAERLLTYWENAERREYCGSLVNQRPDGSVVIEQPDGKRAVYRKVVGAV